MRRLLKPPTAYSIQCLNGKTSEVGRRSTREREREFFESPGGKATLLCVYRLTYKQKNEEGEQEGCTELDGHDGKTTLELRSLS